MRLSSSSLNVVEGVAVRDRLRVQQDDAADVQQLRRRLQVEEAGVESTESIHGRSLDRFVKHVLVSCDVVILTRARGLRATNLLVMAYLRRQLVTTALTANALRPVRWPLRHHPRLLRRLAGQRAGSAAARRQCGRHGRRAGRTPRHRPLGPQRPARPRPGGASTAGLGYLIVNANRAASHVETTLRDGLGEDYLDDLEETPDVEDLKTRLREVARPFKMAKPDVEVIRDINYTEGGKRARLDIYRPKGVDLENAPVLVQIHGGAWTIGTKEQQGLLLMNRMAERGWVCVAMNYRLAPKHPLPAQIIDVKKAIAWTRENIASYGGDPSYLVVTGGSAGGHLAALAALTPGEPEYQPGLRGRRHQRRRLRPVLRRLRPGRPDRREARGPDARRLPGPARLQGGPREAPRRLRQGLAAGPRLPRRAGLLRAARRQRLAGRRRPGARVRGEAARPSRRRR